MLYYPPEMVQALDQLRRKAEGAAVTERERNWVRVTRDEFDYIRLLTRALYLYKAYLVNRDPDDLAQLRHAVAAFDEYRKRICSYEGEYVRDYFVGHGYLCCFLISGVNAAPQPGQVWLGNLARERQPVRQLYQWSKGGAGGFCDPKSFGRFFFEKP